MVVQIHAAEGDRQQQGEEAQRRQRLLLGAELGAVPVGLEEEVGEHADAGDGVPRRHAEGLAVKAGSVGAIHPDGILEDALVYDSLDEQEQDRGECAVGPKQEHGRPQEHSEEVRNH